MGTPSQTSAEPVQTNRTWIMTVLVAVYASNFIDRTIINVLQQPIKVELGLQDWQLGMLGGTTFAIFYTVLGVYVARIAERSDRTTVLTICILLWSAFTMLCGAVTGFAQLLLLRVGVAVGEAGATPTGHSLISDYYPPEKRAAALAVFASGNTIGAMLGALLGGVVGHAWGWRWAFVVAGAPGVILALLTWASITFPAKHHSSARDPDDPRQEPRRRRFRDDAATREHETEAGVARGRPDIHRQQHGCTHPCRHADDRGDDRLDALEYPHRQDTAPVARRFLTMRRFAKSD